MMMLRACSLLLLALCACTVHSESYGLFVAGSKTFDNYRHQADTCHAFHAATAAGIAPQNAFVAIYDDVANDVENPYPGKLFNKPTGKKAGDDVRAGIDGALKLSGEALTKEALLSALVCNSTDTPCVDGGKNDDLFVFWAGHGSDGTLLMPTGSALYADELMDALKARHAAGRFGRLLFYLEACDSGAMFDGFESQLSDINALALTAAKPNENSYPAYCCNYFHDECMVAGQDIGSCLGDLFATGILEDLDKRTSGETVKQQFAVGAKAALPGGGNPGSHAESYGSQALLSTQLSEFFGGSASNAAAELGRAAPGAGRARAHVPAPAPADVSLAMRRWRLDRARRGGNATEVVRQQRLFDDEVARRQRVLREFDTVARGLFGGDHDAHSILLKRQRQEHKLGHQQSGEKRRSRAFFDCLRAAEAARRDAQYDAYSVQFVPVLAAACNAYADDTHRVIAAVNAAQSQ